MNDFYSFFVQPIKNFILFLSRLIAIVLIAFVIPVFCIIHEIIIFSHNFTIIFLICILDKNLNYIVYLMYYYEPNRLISCDFLIPKKLTREEIILSKTTKLNIIIIIFMYLFRSFLSLYELYMLYNLNNKYMFIIYFTHSFEIIKVFWWKISRIIRNIDIFMVLWQEYKNEVYEKLNMV